MKSIFLRGMAFVLCFVMVLGGSPLSAIAMSNTSQFSIQTDISRGIWPSASIETHSTNPAIAWLWFWPRRPKGDSGDLPNTVSGGRRGKCSAIRQNLKAIVPLPLDPSLDPSAEVNEGPTEELEDLFRLTDNPSPQLWFYTAALPLGVDQAELMIQSTQANGKGKEIDVLEAPIAINDIPIQESGIFSVDFGDFERLDNILEAGKYYKWYFSLICEKERPSRNPSVSGWIQYEPYTEETLSAQLNNGERIEQYLDRKFWHSALTLAVEERCKPDPEGINKANWVDLIESAGFDAKVSQAEILSCPRSL